MQPIFTYNRVKKQYEIIQGGTVLSQHANYVMALTAFGQVK